MLKKAILVSLVLLAGSAYLGMASKAEPVPIRRALDDLPMTLGAWEGQPAAPMDSRVLAVLGVDDYLQRVYVSPERVTIGLYIGYYQSQRQGDTIHSPLNCLPGAGWNPVERAHITIPVEDEPVTNGSEEIGIPSRAIEVNSIVIQKGLDRQLVVYWYQSHGRVVASEYWGKIYTVLDAIRTNRTDAALVRVIASIAGLDKQAQKSASDHAIRFVKQLFPLLKDYLPE